MTMTPIRPSADDTDTEDTVTPESRSLAALRTMLKDEAQREHWPEIRQAIDYLRADTFARDLAA